MEILPHLFTVFLTSTTNAPATVGDCDLPGYILLRKKRQRYC